MQVHVFKSVQRDIYGFDPEPTGASLPIVQGPWKLVDCIDIVNADVSRYGTRPASIRRDITALGYHVAG